MNKIDERLIIGLDVPTVGKALHIIDQLGDTPWGYKIGPEMVLTQELETLTRAIKNVRARIFLDNKWANTPDVTAACVKRAGDWGFDMCNIMLDGTGPEMIEKSAESAASYPEMMLLGVTVLTTRDDNSLKATGVSDGREAQVIRLAGLAKNSGINVLVASSNEIVPLRGEKFGNFFGLVVPGTRSAGADAKDQKNITLPAVALQRGANWLVIASQVVKAENPKQAYDDLVAEIQEACL